MILYLDIIFLINFLANGIILWTTANILRIYLSKTRLVLAAALGAAYAVLASLPELNWLANFTPELLISAVMVLISFSLVSPVFFLKCWAAMYMVAFVFGGTVLGLGYFMDKVVLFTGFPKINLGTIIAGMLIGMVIISGLIYFLRQNNLNKNFCIPLVIVLAGKKIKLVGLVDTGNRLIDPLTGRPVIVVEYEAVRELLPLVLVQFMAAGKEPDLSEIVQYFGTGEWVKRLSIIPYSSLGKENGIMLGFKPDLVIIEEKGKKVKKTGIMIGLCRQVLCSDQSYRALVNPQLVQ